MASITKRILAGSLTVYRVRVRKHGFPTQSKTFLKRADGVAWAATVEADIARGVFEDRSSAQRTTIREGLKRYLAEVTPKKKSHVAEAGLIERMMKTSLASYTFETLRSEHISEWMNTRLRKVTTETVFRELALLSHLYKVAHASWGIAGDINPVRSVPKPKHGKPRARRLQAGEEEEILRRARAYGEPLPTIIVLAIETAMRRGEIVSLQWDRVDFRRRILHLRETKNGESRDVPLSSRALAALQRLPRRIDGLVFGIRAGTVTQAFRRITGLASAKKGSKVCRGYQPLQDLRFHDLRHEAVSRLFERGLNPMQVAAISGHKTLQMLKRYTQLRAEDLVEMLG